MTEKDLKQRTKMFSLRILKLIDSLPETRSGRITANQWGRAGTSVGANYRAVCRSRSGAEMISKFSVVEEEADECCFGMELIGDHGLIHAETIAFLLSEANELPAIMVASRWTLAAKNSKAGIQNRK